MASLVLTDSSQLTDKSFEKLPDQIMYPYAEPYDQQKHIGSLSGYYLFEHQRVRKRSISPNEEHHNNLEQEQHVSPFLHLLVHTLYLGNVYL
uniref:Peptidase S8 pro-domain domain-containing protein n=1 Tax=Timema shepardi TaxID=629360 RepID=A0A7R9AWC4_TIMSH|nr:unnamed protein product [Timema shepardi]